jgi:hypothetical protein
VYVVPAIFSPQRKIFSSRFKHTLNFPVICMFDFSSRFLVFHCHPPYFVVAHQSSTTNHIIQEDLSPSLLLTPRQQKVSIKTSLTQHTLQIKFTSFFLRSVNVRGLVGAALHPGLAETPQLQTQRLRLQRGSLCPATTLLPECTRRARNLTPWQ